MNERKKGKARKKGMEGGSEGRRKEGKKERWMAGWIQIETKEALNLQLVTAKKSTAAIILKAFKFYVRFKTTV